MNFVNVILPLPIPNLYTYYVQEVFRQDIAIGKRILVPFGGKKVTTAIVESIHDNKPLAYDPKEIIAVLDDEPSVNHFQSKFYQWVAEYYVCYRGEVIHCALPSGLKVSSESYIQLNPLINYQEQDLTEKERLLCNEIKRRDALTYQQAADVLEVRSAHQYIKKLLSKDIILTYSEAKERFSPKIEKQYSLSVRYQNQELISQLLDSLQKKPAQQDILLHYLQLTKGKTQVWLPKSSFNFPTLSESAFKTLVKNEVFQEREVVVQRIKYSDSELNQELTLSPLQQKAYFEILSFFEKRKTVLLHGVTGSGKTEVYIALIKQVLAQGQQALFLLPEISITTQMIVRLKKVFGSKLGVYHSKFSDNERVEVWNGLKNGNIEVVLGVRSAVFLPFSQLGLVVIDEEHEQSYKQTEPSPRYNGRDAALMLAHIHGARAVLGSATPSVEIYYHAKSGKFGLVELLERFNNQPMPRVELVDLKVERKNKTLKQEFSSLLIQRINESVANKEQVILFQNRRGYAPFVNCEVCGYIPGCKSCNVKLTYHYAKKILNCHYCGHQEPYPNVCPACGSTQMKMMGYGTERLEETTRLLFPNAKVQRMDMDTTRSKKGFENIINAMENKEIDILVGTQMVTKGLDFGEVNTVGVFDIDRMLHFPDFRSVERVFQTLTQVSGRAGRKSGKGRVVIQTTQPYHLVFKWVSENDYKAFYQNEISERQTFLYPPFTRVIKVILKDYAKELAEKSAIFMSDLLAKNIGKSRVLGPDAPVIDKIRDLYIQEIFIKLEKGHTNLEQTKQYIAKCAQQLNLHPEFKKVKVIIDVDPV